MEERSLTTNGASVIHNVRRTYQDQTHGHILEAHSRQCEKSQLLDFQFPSLSSCTI
jgi:hypothetical protein